MVSKKSERVRVAVIGGSGVYQIEGMKVRRRVWPNTPFGKPSDPIVIGEYGGELCAFLPRHGLGHRYLPGEIPQRANFYALKELGVEFALALSTCGSLRDEYPPRHFVVPHQIIDQTTGRTSTFFGNGIVAHIAFARPFSTTLSQLVFETAQEIGLAAHHGGSYLCMDGPAFSTRAESESYRKLGGDVIGMTAIPEAKLAREAEIAYALVAMITDFDSWKESDEVSLQVVINCMLANAENAKKLVAKVLPKIKTIHNDCADALKGAIFTDPKVMPVAMKKKLRPLISKYIK